MAWILLPFSGLRDRKATICGGISKINQCQMSEMIKYLNILTKIVKLFNSNTAFPLVNQLTVTVFLIELILEIFEMSHVRASCHILNGPDSSESESRAYSIYKVLSK